MSQTSGTFDTYDAVGIRESFENSIYRITPTKTPFISGLERISVENTHHEWQTESLSAVDTTNAVIEGDEATYDTVVTTTRVGNYTQLSDKAAIITSTQDAVRNAGKSTETAHQKARKMLELRRDMEAILTSNQASVAGNSSTARKLGGYEAWVETNDIGTAGTDSWANRGTSGANGGFSGGIAAAATDGTQRAFSEEMLKRVLQKCYENGGEPDMISLGAFNRTVASGFTGNQTRMQDTSGGTLKTSIRVYESDFGEHKVVCNLFQRSRSALVYDTAYWALGILQPLKIEPLAKIGHSNRWLISTEYTLVARNESSSGIVADLTTS